MKMKITPFIAAAAAIAASLCACKSTTTIDPTPRDVTGVLKYTGATYAPFHAPAPYNFAIYNVNGRFIAYVDTTQIVIPQLNTYRDKLVEIRGAIAKDDGYTVLRAESMKIKR